MHHCWGFERMSDWERDGEVGITKYLSFFDSLDLSHLTV